MASVYNYKWQKARATYLKEHTRCVECAKRGKLSIASVVDHISPHRGDQEKFWDINNWQALCTNCHNSYKQRIEKSGTVIGCDVSGVPMSKAHHWHKR